MYQSVSQKITQLPREYSVDLLPAIRDVFEKRRQTIVVLDDDPTGTQTCYDVMVLTTWRVELIAEELRKNPSILYILTNSRSLPENEAVELAQEIGRNLQQAVSESGRDIVVVSRSDSTLRGHFPAEVDAVAQSLGITKAITVLIPAFIEGGRYTIDDVHYLVENHQLVPVSDTPFAQDVVFGYTHSNLKQWVEEKTNGRIQASAVHSISLNEIRTGGPEAVSEAFTRCTDGSVCVVNAVSYRDLEVVVMGLLLAEASGKQFLYRTSATFVPIRAGLASGKPFIPTKTVPPSANGYLVIVGSHVPKTTQQLSRLLKRGMYKTIEIDVAELLISRDSAAHAVGISQQTDNWLEAGENVVLYTSRQQKVGIDAVESLTINSVVSNFLVKVLHELVIRPKFIVAKGGITSSDLAANGLSAEKALVLGPIIPGVPVWQMTESSKFPGIRYVVFPGNVGDEAALETVCQLIDMSYSS
ncbi:four-carbon acid sugar kinase family protein [Spirosoma aerolatum]|uniref:four-carbon acid sugar kinase family protein n=1 Tax=Spirosoma aerolatum TaxID=1211326 RepID=UPI0009AE70AF|nr:four-carbon acid sugar kinase family protein [Spirosoma aerolatum]